MAKKPIQFGRLADMVRECEDYRDDLSADRIRAMEYYDGTMADTPSDAGRSGVVSRDVRSAIRKVMPSIIRTILGNDEIVEYSPVNQEDEGGAAQASDYVNYVVIPESHGRRAIENAIFDALSARNGVLRWWWEERAETSFSRHTGLTDDEFAKLVSDEGVEALEHSERDEIVETPQGIMPLRVHDLRIRRTTTRRTACVSAVPRDEFLIHPDALSVADSPVVGMKTKRRRSDLVAIGYDKARVDALPSADGDMTTDGELYARRGFVPAESGIAGALEEIDYFELYVRDDQDGDGIAELRRMCFGGAIAESGLLSNDEVDDVQYCDITSERRPHQWEGNSIADDVMEIQRIKTVLIRQTLDNIYWQNNPQPIMQEGMIINPDAVYNAEFGKPIRVNQGVDVRGALGFNAVPFVARDSFAMLDYLDGELTDRTGVSDAAGGLAPDALQNMTAKGAALIEQAGISQIELRVRTIADGLKDFFRGLLRLIIRHQDVPRTVRLRNEWVTFDPRQWNAEMDATVNTGLGAGTRERDMIMMQNVIGLQEKLLSGMGPDNPFVKPENVSNALRKLVEAAGLRSPGLYFTEPDPEEVRQRLAELKNKPNPDHMKLQAQMQLEQAKMQSAAAKERAQMEADLVVKEKEIQANSIAQAEKLQADALQSRANIELEREKMAQAARIEAAKLDQQWKLALLNAGARQHPDGTVADAEDDRANAFVSAMGNLVAALGSMQSAQNRPKRIIRDENGDVIGVETYDPNEVVN